LLFLLLFMIWTREKCLKVVVGADAFGRTSSTCRTRPLPLTFVGVPRRLHCQSSKAHQWTHPILQHSYLSSSRCLPQGLTDKASCDNICILSRKNYPSRCFSLRLSSNGPEYDDNDDDPPPVVSTLIPTRSCTRDRPFEWEELIHILRDGNLSDLCRSTEVEECYGHHRRQVLQEYESLFDFILHSKFQQSRKWNSLTQKWSVTARLPSTTTVTKTSFHDDDDDDDDDNLPSIPETIVVLVPNDFPYYFAEGVEHWVLWKWGGEGVIQPSEVNQAIHETFSYDSNDSRRILYWENPPHLKSLPEIDHVHILVNNNKNKTVP